MLFIIAYSNSYIRHAISVMLQQYLGIEAKALYDQIDSKLIGSNLLKKQIWQTATIDKADCTLSDVCNLLKIKSKAYIFENILKIP